MENHCFYVAMCDMTENTYQLTRTLRPDPGIIVRFPREKGKGADRQEAIETGEALKAVLSAVSSATEKLRKGAGDIILGKDPITIHLTGSIAGIDPDLNRIFVRIKPKGKEAQDAQKR